MLTQVKSMHSWGPLLWEGTPCLLHRTSAQPSSGRSFKPWAANTAMWSGPPFQAVCSCDPFLYLTAGGRRRQGEQQFSEGRRAETLPGDALGNPELAPAAPNPNSHAFPRPQKLANFSPVGSLTAQPPELFSHLPRQLSLYSG